MQALATLSYASGRCCSTVRHALDPVSIALSGRSELAHPKAKSASSVASLTTASAAPPSSPFLHAPSSVALRLPIDAAWPSKDSLPDARATCGAGRLGGKQAPSACNCGGAKRCCETALR
eukprot:6184819-Prymnesium_polylepis.1